MTKRELPYSREYWFELPRKVRERKIPRKYVGQRNYSRTCYIVKVNVGETA